MTPIYSLQNAFVSESVIFTLNNEEIKEGIVSVPVKTLKKGELVDFDRTVMC